LLEKKRPALLTVYLSGLDTEEHASGPFSQQSNEVLERLDTVVGDLRAAAEKAAPGRATVCVVSDHGFAAIQHDVNLYGAFREAGLFTLSSDGKIADWKAMPWPAGGSAAIMLADPKDEAVKAKVKQLLDTLARDPANGIERIVPAEEIQRDGGFPGAAFVVALQVGYEMAYALSPPLITKPSNLGMHGYMPERPEMRSTFLIVGPGIAKGRSLGEIDMRQIAPTVAAPLRLHLAGAELSALPLMP
jgi:predicted AlkP superfamily pyrophosphatase or phosphodiesterase